MVGSEASAAGTTELLGEETDPEIIRNLGEVIVIGRERKAVLVDVRLFAWELGNEKRGVIEKLFAALVQDLKLAREVEITIGMVLV